MTNPIQTKLDPNSSVFPTSIEINGGLTVRQHFALTLCAALQSNPNKVYDWEGAAYDAVKQTDALINELNKLT